MSCVVIYGKGKLSDAEMSEVKCPLNVSDRERRQYIRSGFRCDHLLCNKLVLLVQLHFSDYGVSNCLPTY